MGAVIGSAKFKELYVTNKIKKWTQDVEELAKIAKDEPQTVYSSLSKRFVTGGRTFRERFQI